MRVTEKITGISRGRILILRFHHPAALNKIPRRANAYREQRKTQQSHIKFQALILWQIRDPTLLKFKLRYNYQTYGIDMTRNQD